ncbi:uncharacterized protein LOC116932523 [Daphnia magna]|uniref:uncharacterized protein LOC116932523 n=1 Tax=Daphnia magna TaxID=35525 RepID=UPI001E1BAA9E|nr:uncharacterized protein LOC116932523 [Daphnia magna]
MDPPLIDCVSDVMASSATESQSLNLINGEIFFVTIDVSTDTYTFWIADSLTGRYFDVTNAEFFVCNMPPMFDEEFSDCPRYNLSFKMPRNYVRKRTKPPPSEDLLRMAIGEVLSGKSSIRKAAEKFNLCHSSLAYYSKRFASCGLLPPKTVKRSEHSTQIIPAKYEAELAEYLKKCTLINHGLSPNETRVIAYSFATANRISTPQNWSKHEKASQDWLSFCLKRNPIRKPEQTSQARAAGFNKAFKPHQIWNGDETNTPTVVQPPKVIACKGTRQVQQTVSAERGTNVTMLAFISASGTTVPPVFGFPRKKVLPPMYESGPLVCIGLAHDSGWMTGPKFFKALQHFHGYVKSSTTNPVLLLLDNHSSHLVYQAVSFAKGNDIVILTFPPHCSYVLQPCDISVFGPFKKSFGKNQNDWLHTHPGERIAIRNIAQLSNGPFQSTFTQINIISGFKASGIFPFNGFAIPEWSYLPCFVTERPAPEADTSSSLNDSTNDSSQIPQENVIPLNQLCRMTPSAPHGTSSIHNNGFEVVCSLPGSSTQTNSSHFTLENIRSLNQLTQTTPLTTHGTSSIHTNCFEVDGSLPGSFTETNATDDSPHVPLEKIRPLTQVCQMTPLAPRKRTSNRLGSTRIITDTPEKDKIE